MNNFFAELKRRNVYKVAIAYAVTGWAIAEGASQIFPVFDVPNWAVRLIVLLIIVGFPIALIIAWAFELTPEGIKRTEVADAERLPQRTRKRAWIYVVAIGAVVAIGLFFVARYSAHSGAPRPASDELRRARQSEAATVFPAKSIAVLPFENLSDDKANAYFASGMQDVILTKLASIGDLKVISRTSTDRYKSHPDDLKVVAQQLGVATILEGSVQKSGNQVLINVQLIDAATDHHIWAEAYPRTLENIFGVEGEVAQKVADALKAKLAPAESARVASVATKNPEAFDFFLKGRYLFDQLQTAATKDPVATGQAATDMYRRAVAADPDFAAAYAWWSYLESYLHWYGVDNGSEVIDQAQMAAEKALALQPDLPEAHLAMGYFHYWCHRDYPAALREFEIARASMPNNVEVVSAIGYVHRRQGDLVGGIKELKQALLIDPRNSVLPREIANSYTCLRRYAEADAFYAQALAIVPEGVEAQEQRALNAIYRGDLATAERFLAAIPLDMNPQGSVSQIRFKLAMLQRQPDVALTAIGDAPEWLMTRWEHSATPTSLLRGEALALKGDTAAARVAFLEAEKQLKDLLEKPHKVADANSYLALVYAGLGDKEAALKAGRSAVEILPMSRDIIVGGFYLERLARAEAQVGEASSAIEHLEQLLRSPSGQTVSVATLRIDPVWDPLRNDPRFQKMIIQSSAQTRLEPTKP